MTLLEALQDIGKGRVIISSGDYILTALGRGKYIFHIGRISADFSTMLDGSPADNARKIQEEFSNFCRQNHILYDDITRAEYVGK